MATVSATPEDVKRLAALARITISEDELARFAEEFQSVLTYVGKLEELSLDTTSTPEIPEVRNVLRADGTPNETGTYTDVLTKAFPERDGDYLSVKQILSHD